MWEGIWATDPWATLAAAAMVTERIRLGTMLTPVPRRRPWELAGQTMTVDRLSNGRVILSAGLGVAADFEERFWIFEDDPGRKVRAELLDEGLELLQQLWQGRAVRVRGRALPGRAHRHDAAARHRAAAAHPHLGRRRLAAHEVDAAGRPLRRVDPELRPAERRRHRPARAAAHVHARDRRRGDRVDHVGARAARPRRPARSTSSQEGTTSGIDAEADAAVVRPWAEAGVTWWLESDWNVPAERVAEYARGARRRAGPPQP